MFMKNSNHTGSDNSLTITSSGFQQVVNFTTPSAIDSSATAVANGRVYIGIINGTIFALNQSTLTELAHFSAPGGSFYSSPIVVNRIVYVADGISIFALNGSTLAEIVSFAVTTDTSSPGYRDGKVYIGSTDGSFYSLNASNLVQLANFNPGYSFEKSSPVFDNDIVYIGAAGAPASNPDLFTLFALNASNLAQLSNASIRGLGGFESSPAVSNGRVYATLKTVGTVVSFNASNLYQFANFTIGSAVYLSSPTVYNNRVYVGADNNRLYSLNASNLIQMANFTTGGFIQSTPAVSDGVVFVGSLDDKLYALNASNLAHITNFTTGGDIFSSPTISNDVLYFGSYDTRLYALEAYTAPPPPAPPQVEETWAQQVFGMPFIMFGYAAGLIPIFVAFLLFVHFAPYFKGVSFFSDYR